MQLSNLKRKGNSVSTDRGRWRIRDSFQLPRPIVQSLDKGPFKRGGAPKKVPPITFNAQQECGAEEYIPIKKGVITV
ncbi:GL25536 [Drosophila persimilis]|uniref:GL25536 n=1 Tax=Drosophila persimilis TaxID=7234 RepID=B4GJA6_DROPE|nr:GL25536 [Drosophila persimilis]